MSIAEGGPARQPRLPKGKKVKGKKVKGKKVKSRDLQCAMLFPPGYFCKRAKEACTARTLSLNI